MLLDKKYDCELYLPYSGPQPAFAVADGSEFAGEETVKVRLKSNPTKGITVYKGLAESKLFYNRNPRFYAC